MSVSIYYHEDFLGHDPGPGHPERIARLQSVRDALKGETFAGLRWPDVPLAGPDRVMLAHRRDYVDRVLAAIPETGHARLDPDTVVSPGSGQAALRAVGAVCAAVDARMAGEKGYAFCALRPPGHHAEPDRAMGFCLFNNVAIAALHAREAHGLERIAVVDFDVHHGNGTEAIFKNDPGLFYASTHEWPLYPGTGAEEETGIAGNIVNICLPHGSGSDIFRSRCEERLLPALEAFDPQLLLISAGFDAHRDDPLGGLMLVEEDYAWITRRLAAIAENRAGGRLVSCLEGGYDLQALAASAAAHVGALMQGGQG